ncbi:SDR family NAD(P)-dependent oxidoreductase [Actinoplanes solisilvae]|uniref:SDR family NAD(P)-dependent oxidoreductase n=1 Tax=Actinoplanes solisilvae TaxID=2486853 RepID=UPI000FD7698E|nr:SDR family NAD(P)-dependent oxidoreductase [Actinoplanes solisilvae]
MAAQTWLITGSSRGFGRALATAALEAGDNVVATARKPSDLSELVELYPERSVAVELDVVEELAAEDAVAAAVDRFGRLDVVVNNAGYANVAPIEFADDFHNQFDTNFWGVYNVTVAAVPVMKAQGGGTIVQFSSVGGRVGGTPGLGSYQAAKFAVDGFTRVLAAEVRPFRIRTLVVEPSGFATDWAGSSMGVDEIPPEYEETVGAFGRFREAAALTAGDPVRAAEILVRVVKRRHLPSHLLLGAGAVDRAQDYSRSQLDQAAEWAAVSRSADFAEDYPVDLPKDPA